MARAAGITAAITLALLGVLALGAGDGDFRLDDALEGADEDPRRPGSRPKPDPKPPGPPRDSGGISDRDLEDVAGHGGRGGGAGDRGTDGAESEGQPQGLIPGVVAAVLAALAGAVSSFVAYQKRRLCFREGGSAPV
ncbi:CD99 antigen isoform X3 [Rattus norvegicus]|uniref:CD99 antigen isoform X3 n=1 Tax=Rattus norvegicus TaxID=10116 RepID=UPI001917A1A8|nr:CD99 antigen isoform X2 [Rattus norvegicus]